MNRESNGTSSSSKAVLSIADLEEKEKLSALFIVGFGEKEEGGAAKQADSSAFTVHPWGQEHLSGSLWKQALISVSVSVSLCVGGCPAMLWTIRP